MTPILPALLVLLPVQDDEFFFDDTPQTTVVTARKVAEDADRVFPNVPYEEKKGVRRV